MTYTYIVNMEKEPPEKVKERMLDNCKNQLVYPNVTKFKLTVNLRHASKKQIKKLIRKELRKVKKEDLNSDYKVGEKETVQLIKDYNSKNPVFKEEINFPDHLRDDKQKQNSTNRRVVPDNR